MRITTMLLSCLFTAACAGSAPPPAAPGPVAPSAAAPAAASSQPLVAPGEAKVGDHTKCIVSGHDFVVTADSPHAEYKGKTYYFCCPDCPKAFEEHPEKYVPAA